MVGEVGSYFGNDDLFFFLCNRFPDRAVVKSASPFCWRRRDWFVENLYLYHKEMVGSFVWWSCRSGKDASGRRGIRDERRPGEHPDGEAFGIRGASGKHPG